MENLSRRAFLTGAIATAAAAVVPAAPKPVYASGGYIGPNPCKMVIIPDSHFGECKYYLTPNQWARLVGGGHLNARQCVKIEMLPGDIIHHTERMARGARRSAMYTEIGNERQAQRLPVPRHNPQRKPQWITDAANARHRGSIRGQARAA